MIPFISMRAARTLARSPAIAPASRIRALVKTESNHFRKRQPQPTSAAGATPRAAAVTKAIAERIPDRDEERQIIGAVHGVERRADGAGEQPGRRARERRAFRRAVAQGEQSRDQRSKAKKRNASHAEHRIGADQPLAPLRGGNAKSSDADGERGEQAAGGNASISERAAHRGAGPEQPQAPGGRQRRQQQSISTILKRNRGWPSSDQEMRPEAKSCDKQSRRRSRRPGSGQAPARAAAAAGRCRLRERGDEFVGVHGSKLPKFGGERGKPRCRATRTAPLLIERRAAASSIEAPSTAMQRTTLRCPAGSPSRWRLDIGDDGIRPDRRRWAGSPRSRRSKSRCDAPACASASISLWRAMANSQGLSGPFSSQV